MKSRDDKKQDPSRIPENDPSKAMDSKKEVEQSNDNKIDQDFPGYPHYPAREDIMDHRNDYIREDLDVENLPNSRNLTGVGQRFSSGRNKEKAGEPSAPGVSGDEDLGIQEGTEADVNDDDLAILDAIDNEARTPGEVGTPQNVSTDDLNSDLDIPGSELDDENELIGEEDEENNYWSLGSDRRGFNEEDPYSGPKREQE